MIISLIISLINLSLIIHSIVISIMISFISYSSHSLIHYVHVLILCASFIIPSMISIVLDIFVTIALFIIYDSLIDSINVLSFIHSVYVTSYLSQASIKILSFIIRSYEYSHDNSSIHSVTLISIDSNH
jgi:hypothetical protein